MSRICIYSSNLYDIVCIIHKYWSNIHRDKKTTLQSVLIQAFMTLLPDKWYISQHKSNIR